MHRLSAVGSRVLDCWKLLHLSVKESVLLGFVILILLLQLRPLWISSGFPKTHDGENHLGRIANYALALGEGQFPPRWAPSFLGGHGYPVFNYNYPLFNILAVPFLVLDLDVEFTMKILLSGMIVFGAIGVFGLGWRLNSKTAGLVATAVWAISPLLTTMLYVRGGPGEISAYALVPHIFLGLTLWTDTRRSNLGERARVAYLWVVSLAFLLAHNLSVVMIGPLIAVVGLFVLWKIRAEQGWMVRLILTAFTATVSASFFWIPVVFEMNMVGLDMVDLVKFFADHFPTLKQVLFSPLSYGLSTIGPVDGMSFSIGAISLMILGVAVAQIFFSKLHKHSLIWLFLLVGCYAFFLLPVSLPLWEEFRFLQLFQFAWRFLLPLQLLVVLIAIWLAHSTRFLMFFSFVLLVSMVSLLRLPLPERVHHESSYYYSFRETSTVQHENNPRSLIIEPSEFSERFPRVQEGVDVEIVSWNGSSRSYWLRSDKVHEVTEPTIYFPGWETRINGIKVPIEFERSNGYITYTASAGEVFVETRFTQNTPARITGNVLTILGIVLFLFVLLWSSAHSIPLPGFWVWMVFILFTTFLTNLDWPIYPTYPYFSILLEPYLPVWLARWSGFDGVHYLSIVLSGYENTGLVQAFFPGFPSLVKIVWYVIQQVVHPVVIGVSMNLLFTYLGLIAIERVQKHAHWMILLYPFSFFFVAMYSEALFFALVAWAILFSREKKYFLMSLFLAGATFTRLIGVVFVIGLFLERLLVDWRSIKTSAIQFFSHFLLAISGLVAYMGYLFVQFNDPLMFLSVQDEFNVGRSSSFVTPIHVLVRYWRIITTVNPLSHAWIVACLEIVVSIVAVGSIISLLRRAFPHHQTIKITRSAKELGWLVIIAGSLLVPSLTGTLQSMPRYLLTVVPMFLIFAETFNTLKKRVVFAMIALPLFFYSSWLFLTGVWIS